MYLQRYPNDKTKMKNESYKEQRIKVRNLLLQSKKKTWKECSEKMERDSFGRSFLRVLKYLRGDKKTDVAAIRNEAGEITVNDMEIMEECKEFFKDYLIQDRQ